VADKKKNGELITLHVDTQEIPVFLTEPARARRLSLRVDPIQGHIVLVKPRRSSRAAAITFALNMAPWIAARLAELAPPIPFLDGVTVPILGLPHTIHHCPDARRGVWKEAGGLYVSGAADHLSRRVHDWFKAEARREITPIAQAYAQRLGKAIIAISLRDTRSRWGSCTADGKLSFSWRLIMAPLNVIHYVVAHEVAHLCELNHSPRFWHTVDQLIDDRIVPTAWLKLHGGDLHRYGLEYVTQDD
jgi:predicted metal-dependent hydrolase